MNIQEIIKIIKPIIYINAIGKDNGIKREWLFEYLRKIDVKIKDRRIREAVELIPRVLSCDQGYYIAATKEEALEHRDYFRKKGLAILARGNKPYKDYPEFWPNGQMELGE